MLFPDFRFFAYCPERSPSTASRTQTYFDECNLKCRALLELLCWGSNDTYSSTFDIFTILVVILFVCLQKLDSVSHFMSNMNMIVHDKCLLSWL